MSSEEFIEYIASKYTLDDVLYILGKDAEWLLKRIRYELLAHQEDFLSGDEFYTRID